MPERGEPLVLADLPAGEEPADRLGVLIEALDAPGARIE
jgi:hypothetical protein